jgi:P27 family predicted phage terminase small subunit
MGKRGPAGKSIEQQKRDGTYRADRHAGPEPPSEIPPSPTWLDREAKAEWKRLAPQLVKMVGLAKVDRGALATYCQTWSQWYQAVMFVRKNGETFEVMTDGGVNIKKHPMVGVRESSLLALIKLGDKLGLSPSARSGLNVASRDMTADTDPAKRFGIVG